MQAELARAVRFVAGADGERSTALSSTSSAAAPVGLQAQDAGSAIPGRLVAPHNYHLTLAFLGGVAQSRFETVFGVGARCARAVGAAGSVPITVTLDALDHWRKPQVLVATSSETPPAAAALSESLKRVLIAEGFSPDLKPFRVHATVARKVLRVTRELHIEPVRWRFEALHLIESASGSVYSTLQKWVLDKRD